MNKLSFLCPHCKHTCSTSDIICPECGRHVRNPPAPGKREKISPISLVGLFLITAVIAVIAIVIFMSVYQGKAETGTNQAPVISADTANK